MLVAVISDKFYTREAAIHIEINQSCRKCGHTYDIMHNLENPHFVNDPLSVNAAIRRKGRSLSRSHYNIRIRIWIGNSIQGSQTSTLTLYIYIYIYGHMEVALIPWNTAYSPSPSGDMKRTGG